MNAVRERREREQGQFSEKSELEQYLVAPLATASDDFDVLLWWKVCKSNNLFLFSHCPVIYITGKPNHVSYPGLNGPGLPGDSRLLCSM